MRVARFASLLFAGSALALLDWLDPALEVVTRDVAVIGGGSSGTYAAIRLRQLNYSVAVVEQKNRLGGHTETYVDPVTGGKINMGVVIYTQNSSIVRDYFSHFDVNLTSISFASLPQDYIDFSTGYHVDNFTAPSYAEIGVALEKYAVELAKYPYLETGFELPYPVPEDLLLPFGDFVTKYDLADMVFTIYGYGQGLGNILELPTIYVMKNTPLSTLQTMSTGFLTTASGDNSDIYDRATIELGDDLFLNSTVMAADRIDLGLGTYSNLLVSTPEGSKIIRAKQIIMAIPPTKKNLTPFATDLVEASLFNQFNHSYYFTGMVRDTGLPQTAVINNIGAENPYYLPDLPGAYVLQPKGIPDVMSVYYSSPSGVPMNVSQVENDVLATISRLRAAGSVNFTTSADVIPTFDEMSDHSPFELKVPSEAIADGFYRDLYSLQGRRSTWWTGAAWHTHDSALLWQFTDTLVNRLVQKL